MGAVHVGSTGSRRRYYGSHGALGSSDPYRLTSRPFASTLRLGDAPHFSRRMAEQATKPTNTTKLVIALLLDQRRSRSPIFARLAPVLLAAAVVCGSGCGSVTEAKLLGSWQIDAPVSFSPIFTYRKDHTVIMTVPEATGLKWGKGGAIVGVWKLDGRYLTTDMRSFDGALSSMPLPAGKDRVMIATLTGSVMVWRTSLVQGEETRLKRVPTQ